LNELKKYDESIQCYDKALRINPKNNWILERKKEALIGKNNNMDKEFQKI